MLIFGFLFFYFITQLYFLSPNRHPSGQDLFHSSWHFSGRSTWMQVAGNKSHLHLPGNRMHRCEASLHLSMGQLVSDGSLTTTPTTQIPMIQPEGGREKWGFSSKQNKPCPSSLLLCPQIHGLCDRHWDETTWGTHTLSEVECALWN